VSAHNDIGGNQANSRFNQGKEKHGRYPEITVQDCHDHCDREWVFALATVYDSDGSAASVQGLQNEVLNGDTIRIPAGTFTWTSKVTVTKPSRCKGRAQARRLLDD
jgi:hypothetical protein